MKKILICLAISFVASSWGSLNATAMADEPIDCEYIITDCGTRRPIPKGLPLKKIFELIDKYSKEDCPELMM